MNQFFQQSLHLFSSVSINVICMDRRLYFLVVLYPPQRNRNLSSSFGEPQCTSPQKDEQQKLVKTLQVLFCLYLHVVLSDVPVLCMIGRAVLWRHPGRTATGEENHDHGRRWRRSRQVAYVKTYTHTLYTWKTPRLCIWSYLYNLSDLASRQCHLHFLECVTSCILLFWLLRYQYWMFLISLGQFRHQSDVRLWRRCFGYVCTIRRPGDFAKRLCFW